MIFQTATRQRAQMKLALAVKEPARADKSFGTPTSSLDDRTLDFVVKKAGKTTTKGRVVISSDGKSRTVSVSGTDAKGKKFQNTAVYDKH
jgi:hypothetical protein